MDPVKVSTVTSWSVPDRQLQHFLVFANFYLCFSRNYSSAAAPLTALTSSKVPFQWTSAADAVFQTSKSKFTSAPILQMPNPDCQFVVKDGCLSSSCRGKTYHKELLPTRGSTHVPVSQCLCDGVTGY